MTPANTAAARLEALRARVERIDEALLALLVRRIRIARQIGRAKQRAGLPILDPAREATVVRRAAARARALDLPPEEIRALFWQVIALCRAEQHTERRQGRRARARK